MLQAFDHLEQTPGFFGSMATRTKGESKNFLTFMLRTSLKCFQGGSTKYVYSDKCKCDQIENMPSSYLLYRVAIGCIKGTLKNIFGIN